MHEHAAHLLAIFKTFFNAFYRLTMRVNRLR